MVTLRRGQWHYTWLKLSRLLKVLLARASVNFGSLQQKIKTFISYLCFSCRKLVVFFVWDIVMIYRERILRGVCLDIVLLEDVQWLQLVGALQIGKV